jgi:dolichol-phosphate hexosyltransferase
MPAKKVCIILPTLNEALSIGQVIEEIPRSVLEQKGYQVDILVADNSSTDSTLKIAQDKGARILVESRRGKGRAIRTALDDANADYIFMLDGDYTYPTTYIPEMLEVLKRYPVVIGSRLRGKRQKGALRRLHLLGNHLITLFANILYGTRISDLCTGFWGFRREVIQNLNLTSDGFQLEAELLIQLAKKGYKIGEIPIVYRVRVGKAKLAVMKDGFRIARFLVAKRFRP